MGIKNILIGPFLQGRGKKKGDLTGPSMTAAESFDRVHGAGAAAARLAPPTTAAGLLAAAPPPPSASEASSLATVQALAARDKARKRAAAGSSLLGRPASRSTAPSATAVVAPRTLVGGY
jgi:hypothetical protein